MPPIAQPALCLLLALLFLPMLSGCGRKNEHQPGPVKAIETESLPAVFTDYVPTYGDKQIAFEMVLVPGDPEADIVPFYIGKTEVTWEIFLYWAYGSDLEGSEDYHRKLAERMKLGLGPSIISMGHPQVELGLTADNRGPAVGMSWKVARAYCLWLSEQTGRTYRLPTDTEWRHALKLAGGVPVDKDQLLRQAVLADNARMDEFEFMHLPSSVASKRPDALGLYDLLGNAAEWVQPMNGKRWVRGGHFQLDAQKLNGWWREAEDQSVWNASYPNYPVSQSWYIDYIFQGIRLVCEIETEQ